MEKIIRQCSTARGTRPGEDRCAAGPGVLAAPSPCASVSSWLGVGRRPRRRGISKLLTERDRLRGERFVFLLRRMRDWRGTRADDHTTKIHGGRSTIGAV